MGKVLYYVNRYDRTERYGGPEEGGWWYDVYTFRGAELVTPNHMAAHSWARHLTSLVQDKGHTWVVPDIPDDDDSDCDHMVVARHSARYCVEIAPGADWDTWQPWC